MWETAAADAEATLSGSLAVAPADVDASPAAPDCSAHRYNVMITAAASQHRKKVHYFSTHVSVFIRLLYAHFRIIFVILFLSSIVHLMHFSFSSFHRYVCVYFWHD